jgi:hypothetical protein
VGYNPATPRAGSQAQHIGLFLGRRINAVAMAAVVDPRLYRQRLSRSISAPSIRLADVPTSYSRNWRAPWRPLVAGWLFAGGPWRFVAATIAIR